MPAANVTISEVDNTATIPTLPGFYIGMVLPDAPRGPRDKVTLSTSEDQFLSKWTENNHVGVEYPAAYYTALAIHSASDKLWVVSPSTAGMKYATLKVEKASSVTNNTTGAGEVSVDAVEMTTESFQLFALSQGVHGNNLRVSLYNHRSNETFVATTAESELTVTQKWGLAVPVRVTSTGTLPEPLVQGATYFVVPGTGNAIKLAETRDLAIAGTSITLTSSGTGTHTIRPALSYTSKPETFAIVVFHKDTPNSPLEVIVASKANIKADDGTSMYLEDVIKTSSYLSAVNNPLVSDLYIKDQVVPLPLGGGANGAQATDGDCIRALNLLSNTESIPLTIVVDAGRTSSSFQKAIISLAESRKDCVGILSVPISLEKSNNYLDSVIDYVATTLNRPSSYAAIYSSSVKIYDKFNDREITISPDGFVAAAMAKSALDNEIWYPVAGFKRGHITVQDVTRRWNPAEMDMLADASINPIRFAYNRGIVIWGQRTLLRTNTALSRLHTRFMLNTLEPELKRTLEDFLHDLNDESTRSIIRILVEDIFDNYASRSGITRGTINLVDSESDRRNYILRIKLFIVPVYSIEQIPVTVTLTRDTVSLTLDQTQ